MTTALETAKYILHVCSEYGDLITNLKLQKLLYYVQVRYLAKHKECFFEDEIEAWKYGPVVRVVYDTYKERRNKPIYNKDDEIYLLTPEQKKHIRNVLEEYMTYSAYELVASIHQDAPWIEAYAKGESTIITKESMLNFYTKKQEEQDEILADLEKAAANVD